MADIYYTPERYDLTIEAELYGGEPYTFDILVLFFHPEHGLGWASDSGCSCPSPFEYQDLQAVEWIKTFDDLTALQRQAAYVSGVTDADRVEFMAKATRLFKEREAE